MTSGTAEVPTGGGTGGTPVITAAAFSPRDPGNSDSNPRPRAFLFSSIALSYGYYLVNIKAESAWQPRPQGITNRSIGALFACKLLNDHQFGWVLGGSFTRHRDQGWIKEREKRLIFTIDGR